ncbi:serine hydrolase domain-containing protein [Cellulomonas sp. P22]|uniref:serine hydrolase domain-containing protein n=1 Tax=Cellulomonas sp. P22 TaxID=3373189 RepID=UPI00378F614D
MTSLPPIGANGAPGLATAVVDDDGTALTVRGHGDAVTGSPVTERSVFHACSIAKTVTAVGVLRLAQDGLLDLDDEIGTVVTLATSGFPSPTIRQLLAHRGGVVDPPGSFSPRPDPASPVADIVAGRSPDHDGPIRVSRAPGQTFEYSDAGYCLLEAAVETVTGRPFARVMDDLVIRPLGLRDTAFWAGDAPCPIADPVSGHHSAGTRVTGGRVHYGGLAASGLWASAADLAHLLADLGRAWSGRGASMLLAPGTAAQMLTSDEPGVGLGVFLVGDLAAPWVMTQGWGVGFQCQARIDPRTGKTVVVMINADPGVSQADSPVGATMRRLAVS